MSIGLKLQGQFKFDLYDSNKKLIKSSEFVDNFITNSGVSYPYYFAFADCFRYLSVGYGSNSNCISNDFGYFETTGLDIPISQYSYIGGRKGLYNGIEGSNYTYPGCGFTDLENGVSLIRQWTLPDNTGGLFTSADVFNEFMVSPGRPFVTGENGVQFCSCTENDLYATGLDCSLIADYYNWVTDMYLSNRLDKKIKICEADKAFARVVYPFSVEENSVLNVTYKLNVIIDTGIKSSTLFSEGIASFDDWKGQLSCLSNITQPGVKLINDGLVSAPSSPLGKRLQHFNYTGYDTYSFQYEYGESFVPPHGMPLEPSNINIGIGPTYRNIECYLSNDNIQFLVNPSGGKFNDTANYAPWNLWDASVTYYLGDKVYLDDLSYEYINQFPSLGHSVLDTSYWNNLGVLNVIKDFTNGLKPFKNDNSLSVREGNTYWTKNANEYDIRKTQGTKPSIYNVEASDNMDSKFFKSEFRDPPSKRIYTSRSDIETNNFIRSGAVDYVFSFQGNNSEDVIAKSIVLGYRDLDINGQTLDVTSIVPFFDTIISSGEALFYPQVVTGTLATNITGAYISGNDEAKYFTLSQTNGSPYPVFATYLSWCVPCSSEVIGCT